MILCTADCDYGLAFPVPVPCRERPVDAVLEGVPGVSGVVGDTESVAVARRGDRKPW